MYILSKTQIDFSKKYSLKDRITKEIFLETSDIDTLKNYIEENLYYHKIFLSYRTSQLMIYYLYLERNIRIKPFEAFTYYNLETDKVLNYEELYNLAKDNDFSLKSLVDYICPKCQDLNFYTYTQTSNATIFQCKCGLKKIQLL